MEIYFFVSLLAVWLGSEIRFWIILHKVKKLEEKAVKFAALDLIVSAFTTRVKEAEDKVKDMGFVLDKHCERLLAIERAMKSRGQITFGPGFARLVEFPQPQILRIKKKPKKKAA